MKDERMNRRDFLKTLAQCYLAAHTVTTAPGRPSAAVEPGLPKRTLGRTKEKVTILGLGTAPVGEGPIGLQEGLRIFQEAIELGVNYIDTARIYGNAEEILGHLVPQRRDRLFIATKVWADTREQAERSLTQSLRLMKLDYVDLVHIHSAGNRNLDKVLAPKGVLDYLLEQKERGRIRFIGISGHNRPDNFVRLLETGQIDVLMCVMNFADRHTYNFEERVLPVARKHHCGIVAMKVYAGIRGGFPFHKRGYVGCAVPHQYLKDAVRYALGLEGVSAIMIGPYTGEQVRHNVQLVQQYKPLSADEYIRLREYGRELAKKLGPRYGPT